MRPSLLFLSALALAGCYNDDAPAPGPAAPTHVATGDLAMDIRGAAHLVITDIADGIDVRITLQDGRGVAPDGAALAGTGHVEAFPEADLKLTTARFEVPAVPSGPCGDQPISLALSLSRRGTNAHVGGALTAYCGKGVWSGVPARLLRLSGDLPP